MAFPQVAGSATTAISSTNTSQSINLPSSVAAGDLLVAVFSIAASITPSLPAGWKSLFTPLNDGSGGMRAWAACREASGSEGSTVTLTLSSASVVSAVVYRITGHNGVTGVEATTATTTFQTTYDPPNLAPGWGSADNLWIAAAANRGGGASITDRPDNYGDNVDATTASAHNVFTCRRESAASSENPTSFTGANTWYVAITIAIQPQQDVRVIGNPVIAQSAAGGTTLAATVVVPSGATDLVVITVRGSSVNTGAVTATFGAASLTHLGTPSASSALRHDMLTLRSPTAGSDTLTVTWPESASSRSFIAFCITGSRGAENFAGAAINTTPVVVTSVAGGLVVYGGWRSSGTEAAPDSGGSTVLEGSVNSGWLIGATMPGAASVNAGIAWSGSGNYFLLGASFPGAIPITVDADDKSKTYGAADPTLTASLVAGTLRDGDYLDPTISRDAGESADTYAIAITGLVVRDALDADVTSLYDVTLTGGTLTVNARAITITIDNKAKLEGGADPAFTAQVTSGALQFDDTVNTAILEREAGETEGEYAITFGVGDRVLSDPHAGDEANYAITVVPGVLEINPPSIAAGTGLSTAIAIGIR